MLSRTRRCRSSRSRPAPHQTKTSWISSSTTCPGTKKIPIRQYVLETDLHPFVAGAKFEEVWSRRIEDRIGETPAAFASLDDLIRMKEAAGRPKDLEDLKALRRIKLRSTESE